MTDVTTMTRKAETTTVILPTGNTIDDDDGVDVGDGDGVAGSTTVLSCSDRPDACSSTTATCTSF